MSMSDFESSVAHTRNILHALDALSNIENVDGLNNLIDALLTVKGLPFACALLGVVQGFLPDLNHIELMNKLDKMEQNLTWKMTMGRFFDAEMVIKQCYDFWCTLDTTKYAQAEKQRFLEFCKDGKVDLAVTTLITGVTGDSQFGGNILEDLFNEKKGDKEAIADFSANLLRLIFIGMVMSLKYVLLNAEMTGSSNEELMQMAEKANQIQVRRLKPLREKVDEILSREYVPEKNVLSKNGRRV